MPKEIFELKFLEELDLSYNNIKQLPFEITSLGNLKSINLISNPLEEIVNVKGLLLDYSIYLKFQEKLSPHHVIGLTAKII